VARRSDGLPPYRAQLALLVDEAPAGDAWAHEVKYDGYRIGCAVEEGRATLWSRRGKDWTREFPEVAAAARALPVRSALLDGEVAVLLPDGRTSFQALQNALTGRDRRLVYFVFDLLHLDGEDLAPRPLEERKAALERLVGGRGGIIRYAPHVVGDGAAVFREACRLGLEGIVSKRRSDAYRPGRHAGWVKVKCVLRQELVVGGFTEPEGAARDGIGALLIGFHEGGALRFAGKVGSGFTNAGARALRARLAKLETRESPFSRATARSFHPPSCVGGMPRGSQYAAVADGNANAAGITPITSRRTPPRSTIRPIAALSPPNRSRQSRSESTTVSGAPGAASCSVNQRPSCGVTLNTAASDGVARTPSSLIGSPPSASVCSSQLYIAMDSAPTERSA
jgi:bifunctional non-homologous end joining protein LigD